MACDCVAGKQINEIYRRFGHHLEPDKKNIKHYNLKKTLMGIGVVICMIPIGLFLIGYVIKKGLSKNKDTNISEFFRLKPIENVREQQNIPYKNRG